MKVKISYYPEESEKAAALEAFLKALDSSIKINKSEANNPIMHTYLETKKPKNR